MNMPVESSSAKSGSDDFADPDDPERPSGPSPGQSDQLHGSIVIGVIPRSDNFARRAESWSLPIAASAESRIADA